MALTEQQKRDAGPWKRLGFWILVFVVWGLLLDLVFSATLGYDSGYGNWQEWTLTIFEIISGWIVATHLEIQRYGPRFPQSKR